MSHKYYAYVNPDDLEKEGDEITVTLHHLVGYCPQELKYYREMGERMREDFPEIDLDSLGCHHITRSDCVKGFTLAAAQIKVTKARLGLPTTPAEYAKLVEAKESYQKYPHLPSPKDELGFNYGWYVTLHRMDYNY